MFRCTTATADCLQAVLFIMIIMQFGKGIYTVASGVLRVDDIPNTIYHICYACQFSIIGVNKIAANLSPIDL